MANVGAGLEVFVAKLADIWKRVVPHLSQIDFYKGAPKDILAKLNKVSFGINPNVNFFELNGETCKVIFHPDFLEKIQQVDDDFLETFLILFLVHEFYHPQQGINSYNYKGIGRTGFTIGMDEYADSMAAFVAANYYCKKNYKETEGKEQERETAGNDEKETETEKEKEKERENNNNNNEKNEKSYNKRRENSVDWEQRREEKRKRKERDYTIAYEHAWGILVKSVALFDEFPLDSPALSRINRYLTTLLHRHLASRASSFNILKKITRDRWQMAFCGVAKKQNEEEDQVLDLEKTRERKGDLFITYSVNGGQETKKILRDPLNFEPMVIIECLLEGKFEDEKVVKALNYMFQNGIDNYRPVPKEFRRRR